MNFKYHVHLCFIFREHSRCSSEQQTESLKRGCDPVLLTGRSSGKHLPCASHQEGVLVSGTWSWYYSISTSRTLTQKHKGKASAAMEQVQYPCQHPGNLSQAAGR